MKELYIEVLAKHYGLGTMRGSSRGDSRSVVGARESTGGPLSCEITRFRCRPYQDMGKATLSRPTRQGRQGLGAVVEPGMCGRLERGNRESLAASGSVTGPVTQTREGVNVT